MYRIIDSRSNKKTYKLMVLAKETNSTIACKNPQAMKVKALGYGITGVDFVNYSDLLQGVCQDRKVMIDEMEEFVNHSIMCNLTGYSLTNED